ncbi:MAG: carboxypeptidase-like regulatory domain-containing protein [Paludibaculum sp.]
MSTLRIPIDASQIADADRKQQKVKVAVQDKSGIKSQIIAVDAGKGEIKLEVDPKQTLNIAIGPESASDEDIFHLQTLTAKVSPTQWANERTLTIPALVITPQWWVWWLRWCRVFTIHGRVVCADGSPVPGAEVRAYDVDFFWWWSSIQQVGPAAVTDGAGNFTIRFRWCCGWWPWWWWRLRQWRLDDDLIDKIRPVLKLNPAIRFPEPDPIPRLDIAALNPQPLPPLGPLTPTRPTVVNPVLNPGLLASKVLDPSTIPAVRDKLVSILPHVPELEKLRIWPWWPWNPWFDCNPDIIFRVTQPCGSGPAKVIFSENVFQTRWDIPTNLNVTLVANNQACCLPHDGGQPEGDCSLFTSVCGDPGIPVTTIGKTGVTAGYFDPGGRDRPFSETVSFYGLFGTSAQADFYEIESTPHGSAAWTPVPAGCLIDLWRGYFDATLPWPNQFVFPTFPVIDFGGIHVYESRQHYEVTHPAAWGNAMTGRVWSNNINVMANIQTKGFFGRSLRLPRRWLPCRCGRQSRPRHAQGDGRLWRSSREQPADAAARQPRRGSASAQHGSRGYHRARLWHQFGAHRRQHGPPLRSPTTPARGPARDRLLRQRSRRTPRPLRTGGQVRPGLHQEPAQRRRCRSLHAHASRGRASRSRLLKRRHGAADRCPSYLERRHDAAPRQRRGFGLPQNLLLFG